MPDSRIEPRDRQFSEIAKFFPVIFIVGNIAGLYAIYTLFHLLPMLEASDASTAKRGMIEFVIFNVLSFLLVAAYVNCIMVHPGTIPDRAEDPSWEYVGEDGASLNLLPAEYTETKKDGQRRHCKWCAKYKPDRTHHCRVCRTCVLKMDHHCPWIYNCVGMKNYKHFFLLLLYTVLDTQLILWTMAESVKRCIDEPSTPFVTMFTTFFGWTLNLFLTVLLTAFFGFHIWLMLKAMTTIEFCEKSGAKDSNRRYASSVYDLGLSGNVRAVLGDNVLLWLLPCGGKQGDGLHFVSDESRLSRDIATGKGIRRKGHQTAQRAQRQDEGGGSHYFYGGGSPYGSPQAPH